MSQGALPPDVEKRLKLMKFWLFGIFCIVSAAIIAYASMWLGANFMLGLQATWWIVLLIGVLCAAVGFGYQYWLTNKK